MKAIVLKEPGQFVMADVEEPTAPGAGEALVEVRRVGICGTDLGAYRNLHPFVTYPRILGHELGVEVLAVGQGVKQVGVGDRCAVEPYLNCGRCIACRRDRPNCCESLKVFGVHVDGGMRKQFKIPATKLYRSDHLDLDQLALVETLGIGAHAVARAEVHSGDGVLVIGAGPIGLGVIQFAMAAGGRVVVMDLNSNRLRFCRERAAVQYTVEPSSGALDQVCNALGGELPTVVFDATGNSKSMHDAFGLVASGGRLVFVGLIKGNIAFHDAEFHRRELTVFASRNSTPEDFKRIISMIEAGQIDLGPWITHRAESVAMIDQFDQWLDPDLDVVKVMVSW